MLGFGPIGLFPLGRSPYPAGISPVILDTHDGINRQFPTKPRAGYDPSPELEVKQKRRKALARAIYGNRDEFLERLYRPSRKKQPIPAPLEAKTEVIPSKSEDIAALAGIVMSARQADQARRQMIDDDADLDAVLQEIFH